MKTTAPPPTKTSWTIAGSNTGGTTRSTWRWSRRRATRFSTAAPRPTSRAGCSPRSPARRSSSCSTGCSRGPMRMRNYYLGLRDGDAYGGGGHAFTSRDFAKLAQLMVNNGRWNGQQLVSADWVRRSTAPLRDLTPTQQYGYLWNSVAYDYQGRKIRAFFAGGNGGQVSMGIPELDLVIAFTGGNSHGPVLSTGQRVYVPRYILPAVK